MKYVMRSRQMRKILRVKRVAVVLGVVLLAALALIGILSITRGTPEERVVAMSERKSTRHYTRNKCV
jgi:ABC-type transporter Mla subunit MlaD